MTSCPLLVPMEPLISVWLWLALIWKWFHVRLALTSVYSVTQISTSCTWSRTDWRRWNRAKVVQFQSHIQCEPGLNDNSQMITSVCKAAGDSLHLYWTLILHNGLIYCKCISGQKKEGNTWVPLFLYHTRPHALQMGWYLMMRTGGSSHNPDPMIIGDCRWGAYQKLETTFENKGGLQILPPMWTCKEVHSTPIHSQNSRCK